MQKELKKFKKYDEVVLTDEGKEIMLRSIPENTPQYIVDAVLNTYNHLYVKGSLNAIDRTPLTSLYSLSFLTENDGDDVPTLGIVTVPTEVLEKKVTANAEKVSDMSLFTVDFWNKKLSRMIEVENYRNASICRDIIKIIKSAAEKF